MEGKRSMTLEQMIEYIKKFNGMDFGKDDLAKAQEIEKKLMALVKKFGFECYGSHLGFAYNYGYYYTKAKREGALDTYWFKLKTEGHDYIKIGIGIHAKKKEYGRGRSKKSYIVAYKGIAFSEEVKVPLNPKTGQPWKIGDTKTHESGCYSVTLTRHGWYSGD